MREIWQFGREKVGKKSGISFHQNSGNPGYCFPIATNVFNRQTANRAANNLETNSLNNQLGQFFNWLSNLILSDWKQKKYLKKWMPEYLEFCAENPPDCSILLPYFKIFRGGMPPDPPTIRTPRACGPRRSPRTNILPWVTIIFSNLPCG